MNEMAAKTVRNDLFNPSLGFNRERSIFIFALWQIIKAIIFMSTIPYPSCIKVGLLRMFGASIGKNVVIRPRVNIHLPWKLFIGNHCWIGEDTGLLNMETISLHDHVAIAHRVYIATGNHNYRNATMSYKNAPTVVERGVWIASCAFIGPGIIIGEHGVVCAGAIVTKSTVPWAIMRGNPAIQVGVRKLDHD